MKHLILFLLIALTLLSTSSCYYDTEEELYPQTQVCKTDSMSYTNNIVPILNNYCISCHSTAANQGGVAMEGYDAVKTYVSNDKFLNSIKHISGTSAMPKNADKLDDCTIKKVEAWIQQGAQNN